MCELYEQKPPYYLVMHSLPSHRLAIGISSYPVYNMNRWTIYFRKWNSYHTSGAIITFNPVAPTIIITPELKTKFVYGNFKNIMACCYISGFIYLCSILIGLYKFIMSVDTLLISGVYHLLPADHDCIKLSIQFLASQCIRSYIKSWYYAPLTGSVYSSKQTATFASLIKFIRIK
jgi:hypothetical protein